MRNNQFGRPMPAAMPQSGGVAQGGPAGATGGWAPSPVVSPELGRYTGPQARPRNMPNQNGRERLMALLQRNRGVANPQPNAMAMQNANSNARFMRGQPQPIAYPGGPYPAPQPMPNPNPPIWETRDQRTGQIQPDRISSGADRLRQLLQRGQ